jgi:hypothetical protein
MTNPIGMALWLLKGRRLPHRVQWLVGHGFGAVALFDTHMTGESAFDEDFARRMFDDVLWWHERAGLMRSCCGDPILRTRDAIRQALNSR